MIREAIFKLVDKQDLTYDEAYDVINEIISPLRGIIPSRGADGGIPFRPFHEVDQERNYRGNCGLRCRHAQSRYQG